MCADKETVDQMSLIVDEINSFLYSLNSIFMVKFGLSI